MIKKISRETERMSSSSSELDKKKKMIKKFSRKPLKHDLKDFSKKELADNYKKQTGRYTEEDFLNPKPGMEDDIWYKLAYTDWAESKGLMKTFKTAKELNEYLESQNEN